MGHMDNGTHEAIVYRGYRPHGLWGTGGMSHMDNGTHGQWGTGGMGHMGNGVQEYEVHGQWGTVGNGVQGVWGTGV